MRRLAGAATVGILLAAGAGPAAAESGASLPSTGAPEALGLLGIGLVAQAVVFHLTRGRGDD